MIESARWKPGGYAMIGASFAVFGFMCGVFAVRGIVKQRARSRVVT